MQPAARVLFEGARSRTRLLLLLMTGAVFAQNEAPKVELPRSGATPGTRIEAVVAGGAATPYLVLSFPDGYTVPLPLERAAAADTFSIIVPYIVDESAPLGYRTGPVTIGSAAFEITELPEFPDASAKFRELVLAEAERSRVAMAERRSLADLGPLLDVMGWISENQERNLLALADQVAANQSALLPVDLVGTGDPDAPAIEITERFLGHFLAMGEAFTASQPPVATEAAPSKSARRLQAGAGGCIADALGPEWKLCLSLDPDFEPVGNRDALMALFSRAFPYGSLFVTSAGTRGVAPDQKSLAPALLAANLSQFLIQSGFYCNLYPVWPVKLTANPRPNPVPAGPAASVGNGGTEIVMRLEPKWTPEYTTDGFLYTHYEGVLDQYLRNSGAQSVYSFAHYHADRMFQSARSQIVEAVRAIQEKAPKFREVPLYKCDLQNVIPLKQDILRREPSQDKDDSLRWGLEGANPGTTDVFLSMAPANFPKNAFRTGGAPCSPPPPDILLFPRPIPPCVTVNVAGGEASLGVSAAYVFSYENEGPDRPQTFSPALKVGPTWEVSQSKYDASSSAEVKQLSATKWQITQRATGAPSSRQIVISTWNRLDLELIHRPGPRKIRVTVKSTVTGTCQGLDMYLGSVRQTKSGNNGCAGDFTLETFSESGRSSTLLLLRFVVLGGRGTSFGPGSGTVTTEVEYLNEGPSR